MLDLVQSPLDGVNPTKSSSDWAVWRVAAVTEFDSVKTVHRWLSILTSLVLVLAGLLPAPADAQIGPNRRAVVDCLLMGAVNTWLMKE